MLHDRCLVTGLRLASKSTPDHICEPWPTPSRPRNGTPLGHWSLCTLICIKHHGHRFQAITIGSPVFMITPGLAFFYVYSRGDVRIILPVFLDDMTFASKSLKAIEDAISAHSQHFKLRDLGPTTQLLRTKIDRDRPNCSITLSQSQYCLDMLERFGMADCQPVATPIDPGLLLLGMISHLQLSVFLTIALVHFPSFTIATSIVPLSRNILPSFDSSTCPILRPVIPLTFH